MGFRQVLGVGLLVVAAACGGSVGDQAPAGMSWEWSEDSTTTIAPTTTTVDPLARRAAVNRFIDAVKNDRDCDYMECYFADSIVTRWTKIAELANDIPGQDVAFRRLAIERAILDWLRCLAEADGKMDPCWPQGIVVEQTFVELYDALR